MQVVYVFVSKYGNNTVHLGLIGLTWLIML